MINFSKNYYPFLLLIPLLVSASIPSSRPSKRAFTSEIIESVIAEITSIIKDPILSVTFSNCFPNTLDTTINYEYDSTTNKPDTFVITGDIPAMWLRDSTNQVLPYIQFANQDDKLRLMILGLIYRQIKNVNIDAYANAFNMNDDGSSTHDNDITTKIVDGKKVNAMNDNLWERKYEIDSVAAVLKLANQFFETTKDSSFIDENFITAMDKILKLIDEQSLGTLDEDKKGYPPYTFLRETEQPTDSTIHGRGSPSKTCGLVKSSFRPSDDACLLPFNIPGNAMLSVELKRTSQMLNKVRKGDQIAAKMSAKSDEIEAAIYSKGVLNGTNFEKYFAYEIDGFSSAYFMDDANVPSLLSLPLLGFIPASHPLYIATRKQVLSDSNPYFYEGKAGYGIGGPHNGNGYIWPMSIIGII